MYFFSLLILSTFQSTLADCFYTLPFKSGTTHRTLQGYFGKYSHLHPLEFAVDFEMKKGTPVYAARGGIVFETKDNSRISGKDKSFKEKANYIKIKHFDGSIGYYAHLKYKGVLVRVGQKVKAREKIGLSGCTGWCDGAHLHFEVHKILKKKPYRKTLPIVFKTREGEVSNIERQKAYTAVDFTFGLCK